MLVRIIIFQLYITNGHILVQRIIIIIGMTTWTTWTTLKISLYLSSCTDKLYKLSLSPCQELPIGRDIYR